MFYIMSYIDSNLIWIFFITLHIFSNKIFWNLVYVTFKINPIRCRNSREREGEGEKIVKPRIWVECDLNFFLLPSMCATFLGGALPRIENWRADEIISWLTNPRRACQSQVSFAWFFIAPFPSFVALQFVRARFCHEIGRCIETQDPWDGPFKAPLSLSAFLSFFLFFSPSFFPCSVLRRMP